MQQSRTIDHPRHREEEAKNDNRDMTSTEYNISKATNSLFLNSLSKWKAEWPNVFYGQPVKHN